MALLLAGDYQRGWQEYEWRPSGRFRPSTVRADHANNIPPIWHDQTLTSEHTLLLVAEQGLGDTIQFVRFAHHLHRRFGCQIILQAQSSLAWLLATCSGIQRVITRDEPLPSADCYLPIASAPSLLRLIPIGITLQSPYLFASSPHIETWRQVINDRFPRDAAGRALRVGLAWQGDPNFAADRSRSIPIEHFVPLLELPDIHWMSLQKGFGAEQLARLPQRNRVVEWGETFDGSGQAFVDSAAVMQSLDLVITSDTAIAHLAGALGVPVWIGLSRVPDWRWRLAGEDCVWYPTARLYRQARLGDWPSVVHAMRDALVRLQIGDDR